ncbi:MAG: 23S rRNA (uracil-5-)-methyltransferase RumA, partial [Christensenellales bacterium]
IDVLVVDPPRSGLDDAMLECILRSKIKNIIYVSCNPATLGKNLAVLCSRYNVDRIQPIDIFPHTPHVETVALLSKLNVDKHIDVEIKLDELDLTSAESKATYAQIKEYVLEKFGLKVSTLYIAQIKKKCGIEMREHYNKSKKDNQAILQCTPEKEEAIMDALRHFKMI